MRNKTCAVVVTYNRIELLKHCLEKIKLQTFNCDILVIDNNSNDGTHEYLVSKKIPFYKTEVNIGGAGGFNLGIKICVSKRYKYIWIMDDDCLPYLDSLEKLLTHAEILNQNFGFIASRVLWIDGNNHKMNEIKKKAEYSDSLFLTEQATFVSLLLKVDVVKKCGLPIKDFFIWGDDIEYTRRIAVRNSYPCYYAEDSVVVHWTKKNVGSKIAFDDISNINRYYYAYRNEAFLYRQENLKGLAYYFIKCSYNLLRILLYSDKKTKRIETMLKGIKDGLVFNPEVEYINE